MKKLVNYFALSIVIFAQVKNCSIVNMVMLDTSKSTAPWSQGFDCLVQARNSAGGPDIGWTTSDCVIFSSPDGSQTWSVGS